MTDDARDQSEPVWCQPQPQVHGLMVDLKRAALTRVECIRWPQAIITVNKSLHNHPPIIQVQSKPWLTQWSANWCVQISFYFFVLMDWTIIQQVHLWLIDNSFYLLRPLNVIVIAAILSLVLRKLLLHCLINTGHQSYMFTFIVYIFRRVCNEVWLSFWNVCTKRKKNILWQLWST